MSFRWHLPWAVLGVAVALCALPSRARADIWEDLWPLAEDSYRAGQWADCLDNVQICYDNAPKAKRGQAAVLGARCAAAKGDGGAYDVWAKRAGGALKAADRQALEARLGRTPIEKPAVRDVAKPTAAKAVKPAPAVEPTDFPADEPPDDGAAVPPDPEAAAHPGMAKVSAGEFWMGCNDRQDPDCRDDEKPGRRVTTAAFWLDVHEVTVSEYAACVTAGRCSAPNAGKTCNFGQAGRGDHPVNCVDRDQATAFCQFAGKRLPTEAEWEKAARGIDARRFPWGNQPVSCVLATWGDGPNPDGCGANGTRPVCSAKSGNSPYDLCDLAGNVMEWVSDAYTTYDAATNTWKADPGGLGVMRGGSWFATAAASLRVSARLKYAPTRGNGALGFRCATSGDAP